MKIIRAGDTLSVAGPQDWFSGTVRIDPLFTAEEPGRSSGAHVTFEPGARTAHAPRGADPYRHLRARSGPA